jgi:hypothetical protein
MALSQTQIDQLNVAAGRRTADDIRNIDYAVKTFDYKPPTGYAGTPISTAPPVAPTVAGTATNPALAPDKIRELDIASANQNKNSTDLANINYAMEKYGYKAPTTFNASELPGADTSNLNTTPPPKTNTTDDFMARIEENKKQMDEYMKKYAPDTTALDAEKKGLRDKLTSALGNLTGKGKATLATEQAAGIPENQKRLDEMNMTIAQKTAEFNKATEALSAGTGLTTVIGGKQGQLRRQAAVEMGGLTAVAQALQGNITAARDTVKRTVDLQYEDAEQEIANLKTQLDLNTEDMTAAEKKKAEELKFYLDAKETELAAEKNDRNAILDLATQAAKAGATNAEINAIIATKTLDDAIPLSSKYLNESEATDYYITKDETGLVTAIDKNTGAIVWTQSGGAAQKWANNRSNNNNNNNNTISPSDYAAIQADMNNIRGSDGYFDTAKYRQVRENVAVNAPKLLSWFDSTYKPYDVLNPKDTTAQKYFQTNTQQLKAVGTEEEDNNKPWWKFWE